ncbi:flagellar protein FlaG [Paenibacillus medicaginis]|uniref:Flagellar protein FlaG n=1 Tax=Paenibacillus medicaginis TaxID=1470560 RepID=A0ABV5BXH5_9BACL
MDQRISGSGMAAVRAVSPRFAADEPAIAAASSSSAGAANVEVKLSGDEEQAIQQLEKAIRAVQGPEKTYEISVHKQTHAIMVKVFDKQTGDLIREIPKEKLLDIAANLMELNGMIIDKRA